MIELTMTVIATGNTGTGHKKYIYLRSIKQEINFSCYDCRYRKFKAQARSYLTSTPATCSSFHLTANVSNSLKNFIESGSRTKSYEREEFMCLKIVKRVVKTKKKHNKKRERTRGKRDSGIRLRES